MGKAVARALGTDGQDVGEGCVFGTLAWTAIDHAAFGNTVMVFLKCS